MSVDLTPFAAVRPSAQPGSSRTPLAILGAALLALAIGLAGVPQLRRIGLAGGVGSLAAGSTAAARPAARRDQTPVGRAAGPSTEAVPGAGPGAPGASSDARSDQGPPDTSSDARSDQGPPGMSSDASFRAVVAPPRGVVLADLALSPRAALAVGLPLAALGLLGAVLAGIAAPAARVDPWPRMLLLALASLAFAVGCGISARAVPWQWIADWPACAPSKQVVRQPRVWGLVGLALGVVLTAIAAAVWWQFRFQTSEATRGAFVWLAALVTAVATILWYSGTLRLQRPTLWTLIPWLLFLLALLPRAWNNANLPYGVWFDEAEAGLQARRFLQEGRFTPITDTYGRDASLVYYFIAVLRPSSRAPILAARLVSAVIGAACAPLLYFMGRELYGWRVGLAAGVLLAASLPAPRRLPSRLGSDLAAVLRHPGDLVAGPRRSHRAVDGRGVGRPGRRAGLARLYRLARAACCGPGHGAVRRLVAALESASARHAVWPGGVVGGAGRAARADLRTPGPGGIQRAAEPDADSERARQPRAAAWRDGRTCRSTY